MKIIVAGSRNITDYELVKTAILNSPFLEDGEMEVVSGAALGVDKLGEEVARQESWKIHQFPAAWAEYGKAAGIIRNNAMAEYADALIAVWDGNSRGTKHMIESMFQKKKPVYVVFP